MIRLGQLVYTSVASQGFQLFTSAEVPEEVQQAFVEQIVYRHWNAYDPPHPGSHSVYFHQLDAEHQLFGWVYNDGEDELGRANVPYFLCYYLTAPLVAVQLESIFTCLHKGPVRVIDREALGAPLEALPAPDLWSYQPERPGVMIPAPLRESSHRALGDGQPVELYYTELAMAASPTIGQPSASAGVQELPPPPGQLEAGWTTFGSIFSQQRWHWFASLRTSLVLTLVALLGLTGISAAVYWQTQKQFDQVGQKVRTHQRSLIGLSREPKAQRVDQKLSGTQKRIDHIEQKLIRTRTQVASVERKLAGAQEQIASIERRAKKTASPQKPSDSRSRTARRQQADRPADAVGSSRRRRQRRSTDSEQYRAAAARALAGAHSARSESGLSAAMEIYTARQRAQDALDSQRMYGLWRKNRKR
ncbi:WD repeat-containing protein [Gloeobacter kilaueensis JS1]|uniref:WD repeat-containing protein n=2 Tax=Gloeobacter TaxID=33071 RepID=U5QNW5_GLOK1|nr:WD repeat-containing protein [Gloeobacter kilaueensis JS1]